MRILLVYNLYTQPGGEDVVFEAERALLERYGHEVVNLLGGQRRAIIADWNNERMVIGFRQAIGYVSKQRTTI